MHYYVETFRFTLILIQLRVLCHALQTLQHFGLLYTLFTCDHEPTVGHLKKAYLQPCQL